MGAGDFSILDKSPYTLTVPHTAIPPSPRKVETPFCRNLGLGFIGFRGLGFRVSSWPQAPKLYKTGRPQPLNPKTPGRGPFEHARALHCGRVLCLPGAAGTAGVGPSSGLFRASLGFRV